MKAAKFNYVKVTSLEEAFSELNDNPQSRLMAGSQTLGPMLNLRLVRAEKIIDISNVDELRYVRSVGNQIKIGSGVRHADIEDGVYSLLRGHMVQTVAGRIAYRGVRNRGTIGGSLSHADPAADWVVTMLALNAQIEVMDARKQTRLINMRDFMIAAYTTELQEGEILTAVLVPAISERSRFSYYKFARKVGEFAEASCACYFDSTTKTARIAVGALDGAPQLLTELAVQVAAQGSSILDTDTIEKAVLELTQNLSPLKQRQFIAVVRRSIAQLIGVGSK